VFSGCSNAPLTAETTLSRCPLHTGTIIIIIIIIIINNVCRSRLWLSERAWREKAWREVGLALWVLATLVPVPYRTSLRPHATAGKRIELRHSPLTLIGLVAPPVWHASHDCIHFHHPRLKLRFTSPSSSSIYRYRLSHHLQNPQNLCRNAKVTWSDN